MEVSDVLTVMALFFIGSGFLIFIYKYLPELTKNRRTRQSKSPVDTVVNENIRSLQETYQAQIKAQAKHIQSLQNTVNRLKGQRYKADEEEEEEFDMSQYYIDKEAVKPFLSKFGMNAEALSSPYLQTIIMDKLKGNEELALILGIIKPKSFAGQEPSKTGNQSNFNDQYEALVAQGQFA